MIVFFCFEGWFTEYSNSIRLNFLPEEEELEEDEDDFLASELPMALERLRKRFAQRYREEGERYRNPRER